MHCKATATATSPLLVKLEFHISANAFCYEWVAIQTFSAMNNIRIYKPLLLDKLENHSKTYCERPSNLMTQKSDFFFFIRLPSNPNSEAKLIKTIVFKIRKYPIRPLQLPIPCKLLRLSVQNWSYLLYMVIFLR